jgi:hypothetical protein
MPVFGLPAYFTDAVSKVLDYPKTPLVEREWDLLVAIATYVYCSPAFENKTWGSVARYVNESSDSVEAMLAAMAAHASKVDATPGGLDRLVSNLASNYVTTPPGDLAAIISHLASRLAAVSSALENSVIIEEGERFGAHGKGANDALLASAASWPNSHIVYDDKPSYLNLREWWPENVKTLAAVRQHLEAVIGVLGVVRTEPTANRTGRYYDGFAQELRTLLAELASDEPSKVIAARVRIEKLYRKFDAEFGNESKLWQELGRPAMSEAVELCKGLNVEVDF